MLYDLLNKDATYHITSAWQLKVSLQKDKLNDALGKVMKRHSILRTAFTFNEENGVFKQEIKENIDIQIEYESVKLAIKNIENYCKEELRTFIKPFELSNAPLFRMKVV